MSKNSSKSNVEKRQHIRGTLRTRVIFEDESGEGFIYFYSTDVSVGGLYFEADVPLRIGTRVFLSFSLKDGGPTIRATGQIARVEKDPTGSLPAIGIGVQFIDLPEVAQKLIQDYIR